MTGLLEIREKLKLFYSRYEPFILPVVRFLLAFVVLNTVNSQLGYMSQLDNIAAVLIVALLCSFLPVGVIVFFGMLFSLAHMFALSMEVALVGVCLYLLMYLLFFRFSPKYSLVVVLTPLLFMMRIPYVVPVAAGLLCGPSTAVSVGCGVAVYYLFETVKKIAPNIETMGEDDMMGKIRLMIDGIVGNRTMMVMIVSFAITVLVVYLIRRMSIDYSWTIAAVAGVMTNVVILLIGDLIYDINMSVLGALLGSALAILAAKVIEFFRFCLDYSRKEKVQFEDDEYYYYVKAIPKITVAMPTRTVKRINPQTQTSRGARQARPSDRSYTTERTAGTGNRYGAGSRVQTQNRRSVTVGNADSGGRNQAEDDYEELF